MLTIVDAEGERSLARSLERILAIVSEAREASENEERQALLNEAKQAFKSLERARLDANLFFIWRDDYTERVRANEPVDHLKKRIREVVAGVSGATRSARDCSAS